MTETKETWADFTDLSRCEFSMGVDEWARTIKCEKPATTIADWGSGGKMYLCEEHADEIYEAETKEADKIYETETKEIDNDNS